MQQTTWEERQWWVKKWLELLDSYRFKKRLERARTYAREGNVLSIDFLGPQVLAQVKGSEPDPYQISLSLEQFEESNWQDVVETMGEKAIFLAQLLAGEMPERIEEVFTANGLSLFPYTLGEIKAKCSCPDPVNPCKHIGAVYYQLADRFQQDPFVIFQLRGQTREQILQSLRQRRSQSPQESLPVTSTPQSSPTGVDNERFWSYDQPLDPTLAAPEAEVTAHQAMLNLLGSPPLPYTDAQLLLTFLKQTYQKLAQQSPNP